MATVGRRVRGVLLLVAVCLAAGIARAQEPSLIGGTWIHSADVQDYSHPGLMIRVALLAQFTPDGQLTVKWAQAGPGGSGEFLGYFTYQLTSASTYSAVLNDYAPKQDCSSGVCLPWPSAFGQPGTRAECRFAFQSAVMVDITCGQGETASYTRH